MALIACFECGKQISERAMACPNCGNPTTTQLKSLRGVAELLSDEAHELFDDSDKYTLQQKIIRRIQV